RHRRTERCSERCRCVGNRRSDGNRRCLRGSRNVACWSDAGSRGGHPAELMGGDLTALRFDDWNVFGLELPASGVCSLVQTEIARVAS
ncbi:MAG: hypothetical protein OEW30_10850, partial [Acidimicrobiia bacterium]|nr:hypothetical protein [Acidimicrobiia bacterium]